jgi:hypothetical protein
MQQTNPHADVETVRNASGISTPFTDFQLSFNKEHKRSGCVSPSACFIAEHIK